MKKLIILIFVIMTLTNCQKADKLNTDHKVDTVQKLNKSDSIHYKSYQNVQIYLDYKNRIIKINCLDSSNKLISVTNYYYTDTTIVKKTNYPTSIDYIVSRYKLGENGFCKYKIDSSYCHECSNGTLHTDTNTFSYDSNDNIITMRYSVTDVDLHFSYNNSNLIEFESTYFTYNDTLNKVDIANLGFCDGIAGRINKNLIKHIYYPHMAPSTYPEENDYSYTLDNEGFVIERRETHSPSHYYTTKLLDKDLIHNLIKYTYIKNFVP
jgi:hypothetical protein